MHCTRGKGVEISEACGKVREMLAGSDGGTRRTSTKDRRRAHKFRTAPLIRGTGAGGGSDRASVRRGDLKFQHGSQYRRHIRRKRLAEERRHPRGAKRLELRPDMRGEMPQSPPFLTSKK